MVWRFNGENGGGSNGDLGGGSNGEIRVGCRSLLLGCYFHGDFDGLRVEGKRRRRGRDDEETAAWRGFYRWKPPSAATSPFFSMEIRRHFPFQLHGNNM
ncbi:hypothetical protein M5689_007019 [Euphorbia peplus]|nr:hypothetical protein M5689_007019 [Euphorbia peplus]